MVDVSKNGWLGWRYGSVPVSNITVTGAGGSSVITTDNGTLQLSAAIAPTTATNRDRNVDYSQRYGSGDDQFDRACYSGSEWHGNGQSYGQ